MTIKAKDYEKLDSENIKKVIELLNAESPITKKEACNILNISYNTKRLEKIISEHIERQTYIAERKSKLRGVPASDLEIAEVIKNYLSGETVSSIAKDLFRSPNFVKSIIERIGVPTKPANKELRKTPCILPDECVSEDFSPGEIVWSAKYHKPAKIHKELTLEYQKEQKGIRPIDYEKKYGTKCYNIYIIEDVEDSSDTFFPYVTTGGFFATSLAYDLGKLSHLEKYGVSLDKL